MRLPLLSFFVPLIVCLPGAKLPERIVPVSTALPRKTLAQPSTSHFVDVPGVQMRSGRMIVRPLQRLALTKRGHPLEEALAMNAAARRHLRQLERIDYVPATDETIVRVPLGSTEEALADRLLSTGLFEYAEPDWLLSPNAPAQTSGTPLASHAAIESEPLPNCPDDPMFASQWYHQPQFLHSCAGWALTTGDPSVSVGICDTGILVSHEDLQLNRLEGYNAVDHVWESQGGQISSVYNHGTGTNGLVAANGNNGLGVTGIGWNLAHRMLRVSNTSNGNAFLSDLQHGARTSIESGDRVVNVSYAGVTSASNLPTAQYIASLGGIMVWAAGNSTANLGGPDRDLDDLLVVGATNSLDTVGYFSNYGPFVDLFAPGQDILMLSSTGGYRTNYGTSFAAPLVSGACGVIWTQRPNLNPIDVQAILKASCDDLGVAGIDSIYGYGRIDLYSALIQSGIQSPQARLDAPLYQGSSPLTVPFRDLSTGVATQWLWDFGDGNTSNEQNPEHTYTQLGSYTVSLTVSNTLGSDTQTIQDMILVDVIPPIADFTSDVQAGLSPLAVQFTSQPSGGTPTQWLWDFGDGSTASDPNPSHGYTTSGVFTVTLTLTNPYGSDVRVRSSYIAVDHIPPYTDFHATPLSGNSPLRVNFFDDSTGTPATAWYWTFGDGYASADQNPSHDYITAGTYQVQLTASNAYGSEVLTRNGYIQVGAGSSIQAQFSASPILGPAPLTVYFTDESIGYPVQWTWDFNDGTGTSSAVNPVHTFTSPGTYSIQLQVDNAAGQDSDVEIQDFIVVQ